MLQPLSEKPIGDGAGSGMSARIKGTKASAQSEQNLKEH